MSRTQNEKDKGFIATLITAFGDSDEPPTRAEIESKAAMLAPILGFDGDLEHVVAVAETVIPSRMSAGVSLVDPDATHDQEWILKRQIQPNYAEAYGDFLRSEGWKPTVVTRS